MRLFCLLTLVAALGLPATALAQSGGNNPFGPLPQAPPAATPTPEEGNRIGGDSISRETMFLIGAGVIAAFILGGYLLTRDARRSLTESDRSSLERAEQPRDPDVVRRERRMSEAAKRKQREKQRAARAARKRTKKAR